MARNMQPLGSTIIASVNVNQQDVRSVSIYNFLVQAIKYFGITLLIVLIATANIIILSTL